MNFKRMPSNTFGWDPHAYLAQTSSVRWDDGEANSVTPSRHQEENTEEEKKGGIRRRNPSDPWGRRTYLYIWISSQEGSVWNLIHKHYSPGSPVFPSPAEKTGSSSEPLWGTFPQHSPPSVGSIRGLTGIWLLPCFIKHTCLQPSQVCLSVKQLLINNAFLRFPLKCGC